ncbi:hypothetical protein GW933_01845 [Candidatus Falkowbacteria bacterium]|uniref:Uncharacterized protein n=1 Tax=Candidatus Buchananbacteria bacterium CG10_big_fil_rev_8_21_14_0_10_33_19 TaxID=1974525 RepID=A0A2H0W5V2_9BACT|nr:hypothetical protein [Candidatus Falkowbacteria bacterium]PIS05991.1 MAG: hypothetical protein COT80_04460 [Candidatus Buchananbacteria bacterium CG10_big_fil_rev_8_21_14_0_10_33_19]
MILRLSEVDWQSGLSGLPAGLAGLMKDIIVAMVNNYNPITATNRSIELVKNHLQDEIWLGEKMYRLMVYVPYDGSTHRSVFILIPSYPYGVIKRLEEV